MATYSLKTKNINDFRVRKIRLPKHLQHVPAPHLFQDSHPNIYLLAKKKTGKTTVIYNILNEMANKNTVVIFFVSTLFRDPSYARIVSSLKKRRIPYILETSFKDRDGNNQLQSLVNYLNTSSPDTIWNDLQQWTDDIKSEGELEGEEASGEEDEGAEESAEEEDDESKDYEDIPTELIIVIDDMSAETQHNPALAQLMKANRHVRSTVIVSTQYVKDLPPECIKQFQYVLAFSKIGEDPRHNLLLKLYEDLGLTIPYYVFAAAYKLATSADQPGKKSHNFLYIDVDNNLLRKNFNEAINIKEKI